MYNKTYPDPNALYPIEGITRTVFLKNIIKNPQIIVGDYTYYDDPEDVHNFEKNVLYLFDFNVKCNTGFKRCHSRHRQHKRRSGGRCQGGVPNNRCLCPVAGVFAHSPPHPLIVLGLSQRPAGRGLRMQDPTALPRSPLKATSS